LLSAHQCAILDITGLEDSGALDRSGADNGQVQPVEDGDGESPPRVTAAGVTPRTLHSSSSNRGGLRASRDRPIKGAANTTTNYDIADDNDESAAISAPKFEGDHPLKGVPNIGDLPAPEPVSRAQLNFGTVNCVRSLHVLVVRSCT
jgi:hypothetical protein